MSEKSPINCSSDGGLKTKSCLEIGLKPSFCWSRSLLGLGPGNLGLGLGNLGLKLDLVLLKVSVSLKAIYRDRRDLEKL